MLVDCSTLYSELYKDVPAEIMALMGFDMLKASGVVTEEVLSEIEDKLGEVLVKAEEMEAEFDWDAVI